MYWLQVGQWQLNERCAQPVNLSVIHGQRNEIGFSQAGHDISSESFAVVTSGGSKSEPVARSNTWRAASVGSRSSVSELIRAAISDRGNWLRTRLEAAENSDLSCSRTRDAATAAMCEGHRPHKPAGSDSSSATQICQIRAEIYSQA